MREKPVSSAMEDYLKAIYELGENEVKTQVLAEALNISSASVTGMLKKLADLKLVVYEKYQGVSLSPAGRKMALETLRHHRLLETYLAQALGYAWHEVHEEAEKLEHVISEDFEERISQALGHPTHDPHGDPIPARDGSLPQDTAVSLSSLTVGSEVIIQRVMNQDPDVLEYLASLNLMPEQQVKIIATAPFQGPLTLEQNGQRFALAYELAASIRVLRPTSKEMDGST